MKRFQFRLETLLRLRESTRNERRAQLADAYRVEAVLQERMAKLSEDLAAARRSYTATAGSVQVDWLLEAQRYAVALEQESQQLQRQQTAVTAEIETRRLALVEADQEVRVLEKLRAQQAERWQADEQMREMKELDDVAARGWLRQEVR